MQGLYVPSCRLLVAGGSARVHPQTIGASIQDITLVTGTDGYSGG